MPAAAKSAFTIPVKLALIVALLLVPLGAFVYQYLRAAEADIRAVASERRGMEYLVPLRTLYAAAASHRDLALLYLGGDRTQAAALDGVRKEVETALGALVEVDRRQGGAFGVQADLADLRGRWEALRDQVKLLAIDAPTALEEHGSLLAAMLDLVRKLAGASRLSLDPRLDTAALVAVLTSALPSIAKDLGILRAEASGVAQRGQATVEERIRLASLANALELDASALRRPLGEAFAANPALEPQLRERLGELDSGLGAFLDLVRRRLLATPEQIRVRASDILAAGATTTERINDLHDAALGALDRELAARSAELQRQRAVRLAIAGALALLALAATLWIVHGINRQVRAIGSALGELGRGNFAARAKVISGDEIGQTATTLNAMLDNTRELTQSRDERDQMQASIIKLLDEVSAVADGDLRVSAHVGPDMTGAIADSFNLMIAELQQIIGRVKATTEGVNLSAQDARRRADLLAQQSLDHAKQINDASGDAEAVAERLERTSRDAGEIAAAAERALGMSREGARSVQRTMDGMQGIRGQVQETSRRIKRLGERSQEIGEIVTLLGDLAERTSILGLNASIQAAAAGDAGRGFMVVAEEVERLAERASNATRHADALVRSVQTETLETVTAMEETTREVVSGTALAAGAGTALGEIERISTELAEQIRALAREAFSQSESSQKVAVEMRGVSASTIGQAAASREAADVIGSLAQSVDALRESVARFRLPESGG